MATNTNTESESKNTSSKAKRLEKDTLFIYPESTGVYTPVRVASLNNELGHLVVARVTNGSTFNPLRAKFLARAGRVRKTPVSEVGVGSVLYMQGELVTKLTGWSTKPRALVVEGVESDNVSTTLTLRATPKKTLEYTVPAAGNVRMAHFMTPDEE